MNKENVCAPLGKIRPNTIDWIEIKQLVDIIAEYSVNVRSTDPSLKVNSGSISQLNQSAVYYGLTEWNLILRSQCQIICLAAR